jgi:UDP-GlcNAc:undecaprenyl-phosphate GlcNAc-1-phosphate transferase
LNLSHGLATGAVLFGALTIELLILFRAPDIGNKLNVVDYPDSGRKRHLRATPLVGGLAIVTSVLLSAAVSLMGDRSADTTLNLAVLLCGGGAALVGYADDQSSTSPSSRILILFLLSAIALVICPLLVPAAIHWAHFEAWALAPWLSYAFIAVAMAGLVNAVNMADGQNGIVIGMFVIWSVCLMAATTGQMQSLSFVLLLSCAIAWIFNMLGRVFLGDAGTYGVTFIFGILAIRAHNSGAVSAEILAVWFFIPIVDCLRLMISRIRRGQAPSNGDRNHFHHRLQDIFGTTYSCIIYLGAVAGSSIATTLMPRLSIVCLILLGTFYVILMRPVFDEQRRVGRASGSMQAKPQHSHANSNVLALETHEGLQNQ